MKKIINRLRYFKISDLFAPFIFIFILPFSLIYKIYLKVINKKIWLICEDGYTARDNGYVFFKYMIDNHKEINTLYVISKKSSDYTKISNYKDKIIEFKSLKHWFYYMVANFNISIHKHGNPCRSFFYIVHVIFKLYDNRVFLQHGVIKDDLPYAHYPKARFKIFICGAKKEYEYVKENFEYPEGRVKYTGLARFDNLHDIKINKKQILFMPTWRNWFGGNTKFDTNKETFKNTMYYKCWNSLLNNKHLLKFIEAKNIKIFFYPHQHIHKFIDLFNSNSNNIQIIDNSIKDIQDLLKESALLVTDYSSVFMDFAYMNKPIVYYQFDEIEFREKHLAKGYFDYRDDGFGQVVDNENDVVKKIIEIVNNNYIDKEEYIERRRNFFEIKDNKNCYRIYKSIIESEMK